MDEIISEKQKQEWRRMYLLNRYLFSKSICDLEKRRDHILGNLLIFSKDGSLSFDQSKQMSGLVERYVHLEEEMFQRNISIDLVNEAGKHSKKYQNIVKALDIQINRKLITGEYLVIFGQKVYFEQTFKFGKIRIKPASDYNDFNLIESVRDDELSQTLILPKDTKLRKQMSSGEFKELNGIQSISVTNKYPTDFYIYCMSTTFQPRLFEDFKADACILIYDIPIFLNKFRDYLKIYYSDWLIESNNVRYFDPFFPTKLLSIPFNKHFSYWYQSEFRIAFKPRIPVQKLEIIYPEIGSLENCCELILL